MEEYSKCLRVLKDLLLPCAYGHRNESIPEDVLLLAATSLKDIVGGLFGLVQQLNMWRALLAPPQPPRIHAECRYNNKNDLWIMQLSHPLHTSMETHWFQLIPSTMPWLPPHRLCQLFSCSPERQDSLREFCYAANKRIPTGIPSKLQVIFF